jgi:lactoylglutathione lyase
MPGRAFPVIYTEDVPRLEAFYTVLGFEVVYRFPPDDEAGYVSMQRGESSLGIVTTESPKMLIGVEAGPGPRFEMFVYVDDLDALVERFRGDGTKVFAEPQDMPWGERLAYVADPDGNPVALAQQAS